MKERWAAASPGVGGREASDSTASGRMGRTGSESPGGELGGGVLEKNLGVPIVVVGCKADSLQSETFEQQQRLHFIQQSIRRFCLKCEPKRGGGGGGGGFFSCMNFSTNYTTGLNVSCILKLPKGGDGRQNRIVLSFLVQFPRISLLVFQQRRRCKVRSQDHL